MFPLIPKRYVNAFSDNVNAIALIFDQKYEALSKEKKAATRATTTNASSR